MQYNFESDEDDYDDEEDLDGHELMNEAMRIELRLEVLRLAVQFLSENEKLLYRTMNVNETVKGVFDQFLQLVREN